MDNPDHKDKTRDNTTSTQTDAPDAYEPKQSEHVMEPDDSVRNIEKDTEKDMEESMTKESGAEESGESPENPAHEPAPDEHVMEPEITGEDTGKDIAKDDEESLDEVSGAEVSGAEESGAEESGAEESGEPSQDPAHESSPDEVRTALVAIRGQNRSAHFNAGEHTLKQGDEVVIQTEHGKAIGVVLEPPVLLECRGCKQLTILRKATPEEISKDEENRELEKKASEYCTKTIEEWEIPMRLVQVEFLLDRSKAIFYFTAEKRVDFRELVRTLAREFSTRIEMKQIGIRDEARLIGGIGPCGMSFCCSTFLKEFAPISVKMAKEQNVILNPNKISGGCGRLLCCLNYEYDQYKEASRGVPKIGKKVNLPEGTGKVRSVDIFSRTVTIDMTDAKPLVIDIDELREKLK